ncbi:hypothetical protein BgiBS90_012659, partial [Biomphalaria glabrata]
MGITLAQRLALDGCGTKKITKCHCQSFSPSVYTTYRYECEQVSFWNMLFNLVAHYILGFHIYPGFNVRSNHEVLHHEYKISPSL